MRVNRFFAAFLSLAVAGLAACGGGDAPDAEQGVAEDAGEVNVYSHRHYNTDQQLFDRFTEETGVRVNVVTASADELITRLETEGAESPADVLITVDAGRLYRALDRGLLQPVASSTLDANVPTHLRHPEGYWYGLTRRARIVVYAPDRVDPAQLSTYEALADPTWDDRILIRSSSNIYNQSLLASLIAHLGETEAEAWAAGMVENMARDPQGGDRDQIRAVAAGEGDLAVVNTYYLGRMLNSDDPQDVEAGQSVAVFFPNQDGRGAHVNVSGAGVTANAPNRDQAVRLLEFLTSDEAQALFAEANYEYPVKPGVAWAPTLQEWGEFRADTLNLARLGELNDGAVRIFDRVGWR